MCASAPWANAACTLLPGAGPVSHPAQPPCPVSAPGGKPRASRRAVGRARPVVDRRKCRGLLRAEAVIRLRTLADERARIEAARVRCHEDAVRHAVAPVTRRHNRLLQHGELRRRDVRRRSDQGLRVPNEGEHEARPRRRGRTRHDPVVVVRVALRFHQRLPPTVGARREVGPPGRRTVEGGYHRLRLHGHLVNRPVPESITFSGWPSAQLASVAPPLWPVSVDAAA